MTNSKKYALLELLDILIAHELGVTTAFIDSIEDRYNEDQWKDILGVITDDGLSAEEARKIMYSRLTDEEMKCVKLINGENAKIITIIN